MKKVILYGVAVAFLCVAGFSGITMAEEDMGPADITLQTEKAMKPAVFPHAAHQAEEAGIECAACHESENYTPGAWTKDTGHALCKDCHQEQGADTKCSTCHPRKE